MMKISSYIFLLFCAALTYACSNNRAVKLENKNWVYCSKEDRLKDKKSFIRDDDSLCLKKKLVIGKYKVLLKTTILNYDAEGDDEIGFNELIIKKKNRVIKRVKLEKEGYPFYFITGFAKIRKGSYLEDLDKDEAIEFALVNYGTDRNRYTKAKVYSLDKNGNLNLYGRGTYNKDQGEHVLFGCPNCHTINPSACNSCY